MKRIIVTGLALLMLVLGANFHSKAMLMPPIETVYYYIKVDTAGKHAGYLRVDLLDTRVLIVDAAQGDYAMWTFKIKNPPFDYYIINKKTGDTLAFDVPASDVKAVINPKGDLKIWYDLFDNEGEPDLFLTYDTSHKYYLTLDKGVKISPETTTLKKMSFRIERPQFIPQSDIFYRIKVDPFDPDKYIGYLSADTIKTTRDSLKIDTARNDLTLWQFKADTLINDSVFYKIKNKKTGAFLAFNKPVANDTVAVVKSDGKLDQWLTPFYLDENRKAMLMIRDTTTKVTYFLCVNSDTTVLISRKIDLMPYDKLSFNIEDETPQVPTIQYQFDSTMVYKVKYKSGEHAGKYLANDFYMTKIYIDSVYAHIPDGQFVVNKLSPKSLINRTLFLNNTTDDFYYAIDMVTNDTIPNTFIYKGDSVEVTPVNYGSFNKSVAVLGYKYVHPATLSDYCHYFVCTSPDSLRGRILGTDTVVSLVKSGETATYLLEEDHWIGGIPAIGDIVSLRKYYYYLRSAQDTTLYLSGKNNSKLTKLKSEAGLFTMKESEQLGEYQLIIGDPTVHKLIVDSVTKQLIHVPKDTSATTLFHIVQTLRPLSDEPDPYTYLKTFPDNKGKGFYEFRIIDPASLQPKWLSKNLYDYAVLAREGESMLRAGSYTPFDLQLWADTARGPVNQPYKPSFYIVKDVDTTATGFNSYNIEGYFLHVIDSPSIAVKKENAIVIGGKIYNRVNYIRAKRTSANVLQLSTGRNITEPALNEYRFYFQETDEAGKYYLVTEDGLGERTLTKTRGYLSVRYDTIYVGPREGALKVHFTGSVVSNVPIPPCVEEICNEIKIIGQPGGIEIRNAAGHPLSIYNILGRSILQTTITTDSQTIPVPRGILIVRAGPITRKILVP